jgi:uncharacterized protein YuzE
MSKLRLVYFEDEDVLHLKIREDPEAASFELGPNVTVELDAKGELIGIEILEASLGPRE